MIMKFAERLKELREEKGLTQSQLANELFLNIKMRNKNMA